MISDPRAPEIIKFSQANEVLRRDTGAETRAAARILFPAIGTLSWLRLGESRRIATRIRILGHDHCKATPTACAR